MIHWIMLIFHENFFCIVRSRKRIIFSPTWKASKLCLQDFLWNKWFDLLVFNKWIRIFLTNKSRDTMQTIGSIIQIGRGTRERNDFFVCLEFTQYIFTLITICSPPYVETRVAAPKVTAWPVWTKPEHIKLKQPPSSVWTQIHGN